MDILLHYGTFRSLTEDEKKNYETNYQYVIIEPYSYECDGVCIEVLPGFLSDGSTGGPDKGSSWIFHDYLYATHCFKDGSSCTRKQADKIMKQILDYEGKNSRNIVTKMFWEGYEKTLACLSFINPLHAMTNAWQSSGERGPEFLEI